ncbi:hypothetical protein EZ449_05765 [Pedobacter frigidisoli]|uniref:Uncharacterized protein n=1 Tax=Pedobacter frigidisoli TaxID=2530455 RepID=A0A4R0P5C3_9SPHI|nr:hypothetical protein [Pedobacter frigidisoli]TCD11006.1 hypothetical protein EZ449_05765 [Pedobacter frigidisoli]
MVHTREQALKAAREILERRKIKYMEIEAPEPDAGYQHQPGAPEKDVWVVSYTYMVFQDERAFIHLDDREELKLIYIMTGHGYIT